MFQSLLSKINLDNRLTVSVVGGFSIAFAIFLTIYIIILPSDKTFDSVKDSSLVDFVRLRKNDFLNERKGLFQKSHPLQKKPPPPKLETPEVVQPVQNLNIKFPTLNTPVDLKGAFLRGSNSLASNSGLIPLVKIQPKYPREALKGGKTGL